MDNPKKLATLGTQDTGQRLEKTERAIRIYNSKKLATLGTQDTGQRLEKPEGAIKNGQSKETGNIGYTRHMTKVRENRRGNQEFTIQRNWQHWVHKTQDKD
jgi:hypothetical protein